MRVFFGAINRSPTQSTFMRFRFKDKRGRLYCYRRSLKETSSQEYLENT